MSLWREFPNLKPCPFCGGEAILTIRRATWTVRCKVCGVTGESVEVGDPINSFPLKTMLDGAVEASRLWNRRANE